MRGTHPASLNKISDFSDVADWVGAVGFNCWVSSIVFLVCGKKVVENASKLSSDETDVDRGCDRFPIVQM